MSDKRAVSWAVANLGKLTKQQAARMKPYQQQGKPIPPQEQINRYLQGAERWRLEAGMVTPEDWDRYESAMQRMIQQGG